MLACDESSDNSEPNAVITSQWGSCLATAFAVSDYVPEVPSNYMCNQYVRQHKSQSWQMRQVGKGEQACPLQVCTDKGQRRRTWDQKRTANPDWPLLE